VADELLQLLGIRMTRSGQLVLHFSEGGIYQRSEMNVVIKPGPDRPMRKNGSVLDSSSG
jgi:hypothetical protein